MENQAYISHVHLKGYKSIRDMEVNLLPGLNIIIGPNGSGKTNFLDYISLTSSFSENSRRVESILDDLKLGFGWILQSNNNDCIKVDSSMKNIDNKPIIEINEIYSSIHGKSKEIYSYKLDYKRKRWIDISQKDYFSKNKVDILLKNLIHIKFKNPIDFMTSEDYMSVIEGEDHTMFYAGPFISESHEIELNSLGQLLGYMWVLEKVAHGDLNKQKTIVAGFVKNLKRCTVIQEIRLEAKKIEEDSLEIYEEDLNHYSLKNLRNSLIFRTSNKWISWNGLSDGTKRLFYLILEVTYATQLVVIEEPELGIHPNQLSRLMDFLKEQSREKQIIITTHSPQVLNELNEDELDRIIVTRHEGERGTQMYHLSEEEKGFAKGYMENGAFLSDYWVQSGFMKEEEIV